LVTLPLAVLLLALAPLPVLPVLALEELDGLLLHAAVVAASASSVAPSAYRVLFAALLIHSLHCRWRGSRALIVDPRTRQRNGLPH
jgi:hypothetical protein